MSASAGRVLIIPKGEYNSATTYNMLDMVYFGGKSYICKQTSTGNDPTNTVYWQIMLDGASALNDLTDVNITDPQNGDGIAYNATTHKWENTTPVGITIASPPATTDYSDGDILDLTGMVVMAEYSTGQTRNITTECTFSPANGSTLSSSDTAVTVTWRTFTATQAIEVTIPIYGVEWDGSSSPSLTRTDTASDFVDPVPYYAGMSETPSSPFDNIMPWAGMVRVEDAVAGTLVKIPKFYYKMDLTNGFKLQISPNQIDETWSVSPAHMARTGYSERDYAYIGAYKCDENYQSKTGTPVNGSSVSTVGLIFKIHDTLGGDIYCDDLFMLVSLWMLYIVEYANWNSQLKIGYGCGGSSLESNGSCDSMPYHTGTTASSRTSYGHVKYRNIEDLWGNLYEVIRGIPCQSDNFYIIEDPSKYNYSYGEILSFSDYLSSTGSAKDITQPTNANYKWLMLPYSSNSTSFYDQYICDNADWSKTNLYQLVVGGTWNEKNTGAGLFALFRKNGNGYDSLVGTRLIKFSDPA